ncbi:MAG TPA: hypothetical protein VJR92_00190 [Gemmatimonadaceae bacterium]|nr:hypothetical protein [Gemmatimonadaceae bacterium]
MLFKRLSALLTPVALATAVPLEAQQTTTQANSAASLRVFLDCGPCDDDYVRTETRWAEFVRDRTVADVHVLVTSIGTGGGGSEYTLAFIGQRALASRTDTLRAVTLSTDTDAERRQSLTRAIHLGLAQFVARTPLAPRLSISMEGRDREDDERPASSADPWKAWVFELGVGGSMNRETNEKSYSYGGSFDATRVTPRWKFGAEFGINRDEDRIIIQLEDPLGEEYDTTVVRLRENTNSGAVLIRSFGPHWGAGAEIAVGSSSFSNTRFDLRAAPAIEYSLWPYAQASSRQLTFQYSFGLSSFRYRDTTIFNRVRETRPTQAFVIGYDVEQQWGSADAEFQYSAYPDKPSQRRLEFNASIDLRITRGLSLEFEINRSQISDQLSLAKGDQTPEEILLGIRERQTDFRFGASIGFNYEFGSIFNSVVNPRFGGNPGSVLR